MTEILHALALVEEASSAVGTVSYLWGGMTLDVYAARFLRDHGDLDYLTQDLHQLMPALIDFCARHNLQTKELVNGDLLIKGGGINIHLGHIEVVPCQREMADKTVAQIDNLSQRKSPTCAPVIPHSTLDRTPDDTQIDDSIIWTHAGEEGYLRFPAAWLRREAVKFYNIHVHVVQPELEYVLKHRPALLNKQWIPRAKDIQARHKLCELLESKGGALEPLFAEVQSVWREGITENLEKNNG